MCQKAEIAAKSFILPIIVFFSIHYVKTLVFKTEISFVQEIVIISLIDASVSYIISKLILESDDFEIATRASFLGTVFASGSYVFLKASPNIGIFGIYMCIMSIFHFTEFFVLAIIDPKMVSPNSFVINHSLEYTVAAVTSWIEFFGEIYLWPSVKNYHLISYIGCAVCIGGELLRKVAMFHAGKNFSHLVQYKKTQDHVLVTSGVYHWFRHPSYVGWFFWSIGTQLILLNPMCVIVYAVASWNFFKQRIFFEESTLLSFFGQQYVDYQKAVGTGIPFIKGYEIDLKMKM